MIDEVKIQAVYPRWRGEHQERIAVIPVTGGLSPLARGTPQGYMESGFIFRFIPAGAGNTGCSKAKKHEWPVYPRWRG